MLLTPQGFGVSIASASTSRAVVKNHWPPHEQGGKVLEILLHGLSWGEVVHLIPDVIKCSASLGV